MNQTPRQIQRRENHRTSAVSLSRSLSGLIGRKKRWGLGGQGSSLIALTLQTIRLLYNHARESEGRKLFAYFCCCQLKNLTSSLREHRREKQLSFGGACQSVESVK